MSTTAEIRKMIIESDCPLRHHSLNQDCLKKVMEGSRQEDPSKKVKRSERRQQNIWEKRHNQQITSSVVYVAYSLAHPEHLDWNSIQPVISYLRTQGITADEINRYKRCALLSFLHPSDIYYLKNSN